MRVRGGDEEPGGAGPAELDPRGAAEVSGGSDPKRVPASHIMERQEAELPHSLC